MTNVTEKIKAVSCKINSRYDITLPEIDDIYESCTGKYDAASKFFNFGYLQGLRAAKAEAKRQKKLAQTVNLDKQQKKNNLL